MPEKIFIDAERASKIIDNVIFYDCRYRLTESDFGEREYKKAHIPGAYFFDLNRDLAGKVDVEGGRHPMPDLEIFKEKLEIAGLTDETTAICYDDNLSGAARMWFLLNLIGHNNTFILNGGIEAWKSIGAPVTANIPSHRIDGKISLKLNKSILVDMDKVRESIGKYQIIDVRDETRFLGRSEPIDRIPGRIPGSINIPFQNLINGSYLKSDEELRDILKLAENDTILYCGSGVTSCVTFAVLKMLGKNPLLYLGSYSDWISRKDNNVELG